MEHNSHYLHVGCACWFSFREYNKEKGKIKRNFAVDKPDKCSLSQMIKVDVNCNKSHWEYSLLYIVIRVTFCHVDFLPKSLTLVDSWGKKKRRQTPGKGHCTKHEMWTLQSCQDHWTQGKSEKKLQSRGALGGNDEFLWCGIWMEFWNNKRTFDRNWGNLNEVLTSFKNNGSMLSHYLWQMYHTSAWCEIMGETGCGGI